VVIRHLNPTQRAFIALKIEEIEAVEAKRRMLAGKRLDPTANLREGGKGEAAEKAAAAVGVSPRQVQKAKKIAKERPDPSADLRQGDAR